MKGRVKTVFEQNKENGCISVSGMGYFVPLDRFINLETENRSLKEKLRKEMSRNAFVEVTGKGLPEIRADAINEMIFELTKDSPQITLSDIENYTRNLLEKF